MLSLIKDLALRHFIFSGGDFVIHGIISVGGIYAAIALKVIATVVGRVIEII